MSADIPREHRLPRSNLLVTELIAVSTLVGSTASRYRTIGVSLAVGMIVTGFIGGVAIDDGTNLAALWIWGTLSALCMVGLYVMFIFMMMRARREMAGSSALPTFHLTIALLCVIWFA
jgi:hypothetical protein